jgi:hypothetical protein
MRAQLRTIMSMVVVGVGLGSAMAGCETSAPPDSLQSLSVAVAASDVPKRGSEYASSKIAPKLVVEYGTLQADGRGQGGVMSFADLSDAELFALGAQFDTVFAVGIKNPGTSRGIWKGKFQISTAERGQHGNALAAQRGVRVIQRATSIPMLRVHIASAEVLGKLRKLPFVDYIEPRATATDGAFMSTCGWGPNDAETEYLTAWGTIPRSFLRSNIHRVWPYATGAGVKFVITDTGVLPTNYEIDNFTSGLSTAPGRSFAQSSIESVNGIACPHGTKLASVVAAPNNGLSITGVAWNSAVFSAHMTDSPVTATGFDAWEGIFDAAVSGATVISMAWGGLFWIDHVADEIVTRHAEGIAFVGAAGTTHTFWSQNWIVFPARMNEVLAVSSAWPDGTRDAKSHYGPQLDLVAYGNVTTTDEQGLGYSAMSRSSGATAVVTGIVALMRQRFPFISVDSIYARLKIFAGARCGIPSEFGPIVNALPAAGGFCDDGAEIWGPRQLFFTDLSDPPQSYTYTVPGPTANPATYVWSDGVIGRTRDFTFSPTYMDAQQYIGLPMATVTDQLSGESRNYFLGVTLSTGNYLPPEECHDPNGCLQVRVQRAEQRLGASSTERIRVRAAGQTVH